jgi:hypothetical protein
LLTNRLCFSELGTSLNETSGSMPATTLEGKTADDMRRMAEAGGRPGGMLPQLLVRCMPAPLLQCPESPEADDLRGSLLRNCFHILHVNLATHTPALTRKWSKNQDYSPRERELYVYSERRQDSTADSTPTKKKKTARRGGEMAAASLEVE